MKMDVNSLRQRLMVRVRDLDAIPLVFRKLLEVLNRPYPSAREIGQVVATDQSLSVRVLRMVNSGAYGLTGEVMSVPQAVGLLGINVVRSLTFCLASYDSFFSGSNAQRTRLWYHSLGVALLARRLALLARQPNSEAFFAAGFLHDVGRAVLTKHFQAECRMIEARRARGADLLDAELEVLGVTHGEIGAWACQCWRLPVALVECVRHHHDPEAAGEHARAASIVHLADFLWLEAIDPEDAELTRFRPQAMAGLDFTTQQMEESIREVFEEFAQLESFVTGRAVDAGEAMIRLQAPDYGRPVGRLIPLQGGAARADLP